jgi:hypothetical protein
MPRSSSENIFVRALSTAAKFSDVLNGLKNCSFQERGKYCMK